MTEPSYTIAVDVESMLVRLTLQGFWDRAILERHYRELAELARQGAEAGKTRTAFRVLIDLRKHTVQSRVIAAEMEAKLHESASPSQRHAVIMSGSALHRKQIERIGSHTNTRLFEREADALAWLLADDLQVTSTDRAAVL